MKDKKLLRFRINPCQHLPKKSGQNLQLPPLNQKTSQNQRWRGEMISQAVSSMNSRKSLRDKSMNLKIELDKSSLKFQAIVRSPLLALWLVSLKRWCKAMSKQDLGKCRWLDLTTWFRCKGTPSTWFISKWEFNSYLSILKEWFLSLKLCEWVPAESSLLHLTVPLNTDPLISLTIIMSIYKNQKKNNFIIVWYVCDWRFCSYRLFPPKHWC